MSRLFKIKIVFFLSILCISFSAYKYTKTYQVYKKEFKSSFESITDFKKFYITPQNHLGTTSHKLSKKRKHSGRYAHKAWVNGANKVTNNNSNHRGYPTIQFQKTAQGIYKTPCYISCWVWLDMKLKKKQKEEDDWFSFATFTDDISDNWDRTVLVNLSADGFVHLQHTTNQGKQTAIFQTSEITFPQKKWVKLKIYLDFSLDFSENGYAKVWQDDKLVSHAEIGNITNQLAQAHFGLYCSPQLTKGVVFNDDLFITEVEQEE